MSPNEQSALDAKLDAIIASISALRQEQKELLSVVDATNGRVNALAGVKQSQEGIAHDASYPSPKIGPSSPQISPRGHPSRGSLSSIDMFNRETNGTALSSSPPVARKGSTTSKIILTS